MDINWLYAKKQFHAKLLGLSVLRRMFTTQAETLQKFTAAQSEYVSERETISAVEAWRLLMDHFSHSQ